MNNRNPETLQCAAGPLGENGYWTTSNSESCYFTLEFFESVIQTPQSPLLGLETVTARKFASCAHMAVYRVCFDKFASLWLTSSPSVAPPRAFAGYSVSHPGGSL
ncbi:hypothetical protein EVAR_22448_1 [Eumeta japonica]|uniref:Uncharacterized protein n=1 Tax=Eumeta variegata TaxID=151549 RepID=A0A4C1VC09_EUMVA|nr:hypothetical protein EVAR_22448_1 [Eumeta japonica]